MDPGVESMSALELSKGCFVEKFHLLRITFIAAILSRPETHQKGQKDPQTAMTQPGTMLARPSRLLEGQPGTS